MAHHVERPLQLPRRSGYCCVVYGRPRGGMGCSRSGAVVAQPPGSTSQQDRCISTTGSAERAAEAGACVMPVQAALQDAGLMGGSSTSVWQRV